MRELLTDIFHWRAEHPDIHVVVDSYYVASLEPACLIDPLEPVEGLAWFDGREPPRHVYLTNRLHERHCRTFVDAFGCAVWCHRSGLHEFADSELEVRPYEHGDELPGGIRALEVAIICPEETALHIPLAGGLLSIGDAIMRDSANNLGFVPDYLIGDDPPAIKRGIRDALLRLCEEQVFDHLLLAHGEPIIGDGKEILRRFLEGLGDL